MLKVAGDVLVGLKRWETLVLRTPEVDMLLNFMPDELNAALQLRVSIGGTRGLPQSFSSAQVHLALGYQAKGLEFVKAQEKGGSLTPFLTAPHLLHGKPDILRIGPSSRAGHV